MFLLAVLYEKEYYATRKYTERLNRNSALPVLALLLCAVYVFTEGLRYGRGVDQLGNYGPFYLHCTLKSAIEDRETLFVWLNQIVHSVDITIGVLPFGIIFIVFALIFWCCLWYFYKDYRKESKYFLLLAILATNYITEWTIRQGVSFSFILLGLHFLERKSWKALAVCVFIAFGIHHGNILTIVVLGACYVFLNKKPLPWKITVPLFIVLEYTVSSVSVITDFIQNLAISLDLVSSSGRFEGYITNTAVTEYEQEMSEEWKRGALTQLITVLFYSATFVAGYFANKIKGGKSFIYNAFVLGMMIYEPFRLGGTLIRLFFPLSVFWFIPLSEALFYKKKVTENKKLFSISLYIAIAYLVMYYGRYVFLYPEAEYVWNI